MIYVLSGGGTTNVAGVIRISYPANSTLVVKGTSSGKQFAKDTNTTSSAKAYIFLAPIGGASYTLTATNSAGKTVSKQVYVAKDQVQSVVLTYELVLFDKDNGIDRTNITGGWSKYKDGYIGYYDNNDGSAGRGCMCKTAIDMTPYTKLVIKTGEIIYDVSANGGLYSSYDGDYYVNLSPRISLSSNSTLALDISKVNSAMYIGFNTGAHGSHYAQDQILVSYVHLE